VKATPLANKTAPVNKIRRLGWSDAVSMS